MVLKTSPHLFDEVLEFKKNGTGRLAIPRDDLIRRLELNFKIKIKTATSGTPGTTLKNGGLLNLIKDIRVMVGNKAIKQFSARLYYEIYAMQAQGRRFHVDTLTIPTASNEVDVEIHIPLDFAMRKFDLQDVSAILNAPGLSSLHLEVDWGDISDVLVTAGNTTVDTSTTCEITITSMYHDGYGNNPVPQIIQNSAPVIEATDYTTISQAYAQIVAPQKMDITPNPGIFFETGIVQFNDYNGTNPSIADKVIKRLLVKNTESQGDSIMDIDTQLHTDNLPREYNLAHTPTGVVWLNWIEDRGNSLDNIGRNPLQLRFTTEAPSSGEVNALAVYHRFIEASAR